MTADRTRSDEEIWRAVARERARLCVMLDSLGEDDWDRPSLCDEGRVRVGRHIW